MTTKRVRRVVLGGLVGVFGVFAAVGQSARAVDANVTRAAAALQTFATTLDTLAAFEELNQPLPFTDVTAGQALNMGSLFSSSLKDKLDDVASYNSADELRDAINDADDTVGGVAVTFSNASVADNSTNPNLLDISFDVAATKAVTLPITYSNGGSVDLAGGNISATASLDTDLSFRLDKSKVVSSPATALALTGSPTVHVGIDATGNLTAFKSVLGFTELSASGTAALDLDINIGFLDPDGQGGITEDEYTSTALADLVTAAFVDNSATTAVNIAVSLDSTLVPGSPDASVNLVDPNVVDGLAAPTVTLGQLDKFDNLDPDQLLAGVTQLVAGLAGAQSVGDVDLPFLQQSLGEAADVAKKLTDFIKTQNDAAIVCGKNDTDPPTGSTALLQSATTVYCQAKTVFPGPFTAVQWKNGTTNADANGTNAATLGADPTVNARFDGVTNVADIKLVFTDGATPAAAHTVVPRIQTAQKLFDKLTSLAGFDSTAANLAFDTATSALTFRLTGTQNPAAIDAKLNFGDQLSETGLIGLSSTTGGSAVDATVDVGNVGLDVTFGIILVPNEADITPGDDAAFPPGLEDRFFLKVDNTAGQHEFELSDAAVSVTTLSLAGRLGYLEVSAGGSASANPVDNTKAFLVSKRAGDTSPMLAADIETPAGGIPITGTSGIPDAVRIRELLANLSKPPTDPAFPVDADVNLRMGGGLQVSATLGSQTLGTGKVGIRWDDVTVGAPVVTADTDFNTNLGGFKTTIEGTHTGANNASSLTATGVDFTQLDVLNATLKNVTTGESCTILTVTGTDTVDCTLSGSGDHKWHTNDKFQIDKGALSMLSLLLDNLDLLVQGIDDLGGDVDDPLPLIGKSTKELLSGIQSLKGTIDELRGVPIATIVCGTTAGAGPGAPPTGDPTSVPDGTTIRCRATSNKPATKVTWTITNGTLVSNGSGAGALATVGPNPTADVVFTVNDGDGDASDPTTLGEYKVHVEFEDSVGSHTEDNPAITPPPSLQKLEGVIESKLGMPAEALKLELLDIGAKKADGSHTGSSGSQTLTDSGANFVSGPEAVLVGNVVRNTTDKSSCTITARTADTVSCALAGGTENDWDNGDAYEIAGDDKKDLVIRLGYGLCTTGNSGASPACRLTDRTVTKPDVPLNFELGTNGLAQLSSTSSLQLEYAARAALDVSISLEFKPTVRVLDGSGVTLEAEAGSTNLNLTAAVGPLSLNVGDPGVLSSGTHNGSDNVATLRDTTKDFTTGASPSAKQIEPGALLTNTSKNESCIVSAVSANELTCVLSGGEDWDVGNAYSVTGAGIGRLGAGFHLRPSATLDTVADNEFFSPAAFVTGLASAGASGFDPPNPKLDCGSANGTSLGNKDACARLSLVLGNSYLGDLGFEADDLADPSSWSASVPPELADRMANALLDWDLIINAIRQLGQDLEDSLNGASTGANLPLVGNALDGGAQVAKTFNDNVITPLADLATQIKAAADVAAIRSAVQTKVDAIIGSGQSNAALRLLLDGSDVDTTVGPADVTVIIKCGSTPPTDCGDGDLPTAVSDLRIKFNVGQGLGAGQLDPGAAGCTGSACLTGIQAPFDIGIPGLPIRSRGTVNVDAAWRLLVDFGLSRDDGPYLVVGGADHGVGPELKVGATVGLGDAAGVCAGDPVIPGGGPAVLQGFTENDRCLSAELGFLQITMRDGNDTTGGTSSTDDDRSQATIGASIDVGKQGGGDRLNISQLLGGQALVDPVFSAGANVDVRFRTGLRGDTSGLPTVLGTFHLNWGISNNAGDPTELRFEGLHLDAGAFLDSYLRPITDEIKNITGPFKPVIDTLRAPLPVVTQLSALVGGGPITLIDLMEAASGADLSLVKSLVAFIDFANEMGSASGLIPLNGLASGGAFDVDVATAKSGPQNFETAGKLVKNAEGTTNLIAKNPQLNTLDNRQAPAGDTRPETFGVPGLSFPFMQDSSQIFGLLMGKDATLIRYDIGTLQATAGFSYSFGPITFGPVPVTISIGGDATIKGRFAIGYDTSGLRKLLEGGSGVYLFDGVFIDDLDSAGVDVPEVQFIGTVSAAAAVDLVIVSAGVEGGIEFTTNLNLNDNPEPDGKLRIEEVLDKLENPICLFDVSGQLDAFLGVFVEIDLFFYTEKFKFEIVRVTLLKFEVKCDPPPPVLAQPKSTITGISGDAGTLVLNMGSADRRNARAVQKSREAEKFTVRQLGPGKVSVTAFGTYQEFSGVSRIEANGDTQADSISLEPGSSLVDADGNPVSGGAEIPFTIPATITGGAGNDQISAGGGGDTLSGGLGNDSISGGAGDDIINGGDDDDTLDGGLGTDTIHAGGGNDNANGGPGGDTINGGAGNDALGGGPGGDPDNPPPAPPGGTVPPLDGVDTINGDADNDSIDGGPGADVLSGGSGTDVVLGKEGADTINGNADADRLEGGPGGDTINGGAGDDDLLGAAGADTLNGDGGNDDIVGGAEGDTVNGGADRDYVLADEGSITRATGQADGTFAPVVTAGSADTVNGDDGDDVLYGQGAADVMNGGNGGDEMHGDAGDDVMHGNAQNDTMFGDAGADTMFGDADVDTMRGGTELDTMRGGTGDDVMFGDSGADKMYGNEDDDDMRGGIGTDCMEGNQDDDTMFGDADHDKMVGGSSTPGTPDGDDTMNGGAGMDIMAGDNAQLCAGGTVLLDVPFAGAPAPSADASGDDVMHGDADSDTMYGQSDNDTMHGDDGTDHLEGNAGNDTVNGNANNDDIVGGSGHDDGGPGFSLRVLANVLDGDDVLHGDADQDLMAGDNASITRTSGRKIALQDIGFVGATAPAAGTSGNDTIHGDGAADVVYGQGGNDTILGNAGEDYLEGNAGADTMNGNQHGDQMTGGSGHDDGGAGGALRKLANAVDDNVGATGDTMHGDEGIDHMAGDNANLTGAGTNRKIELYDLDFGGDAPVVDGATSGDDTMNGNAGSDRMYGQGDADAMHGNAGEDYMEGNSGADTMDGDGGQDDMVGGSGHDDGPDGNGRDLRNVLDTGDTMRGGTQTDVMLGDNGGIVRPGGTNTFKPGVTTVKRDVTLYDVQKVAGPVVSADVSGGDTMDGNEDDDAMFGQGARDTMHGNAGDDDMEGNHAADTMFGDAGQDDLIGGGSSNTGVISPTSVGNGLLDAADAMHGESGTTEGATGGNGADVMAGDNSRITRDVNGAKLWVIDPASDDFVRTIVMFDVDNVDEPAVDPLVFGGDTMYGNDNDDVMRGQGGRDAMYGGAGDDDMEGNSDADRMFGQGDQDDMIGGSTVAGRRDVGDHMEGGAAADFQLGDNGTLTRLVKSDDTYLTFEEANTTTIVRHPVRFDVAGPAGASGPDWIQGDGGDDYQWGQDANDEMHGNAGNDDMFGELGNDRMFGEAGEDAMLGDRGAIVDRLIDGSSGDPQSFTLSINSPPAITFTSFRDGAIDRRFDLLHDQRTELSEIGFQGDTMASPGLNVGGDDLMRGGPDHDSMHGGFGADLMNGDSGGDWMFGDDGADAMWGGKGCDPTLGDTCLNPDLSDRGTNDKWVDILFGGYGAPGAGTTAGGADLLDYRPRPGVDPVEWFDATDTDDADPLDNQHHQGIDWIYGGWDRDVIQGDVADNGPNPGDRLLDWTGAYNLFTHCNAAYGGFNDVRLFSPDWKEYLEKLAYAVGAGPTQPDVTTSGTSGFRELALVYSKDVKENSGKAFPTTPGHFDSFSCAP